MIKSRSRPRQLILEIIAQLPQGEHVSAQELRDKVLERGEKVSLSTIYRSLERLNEMGEVRSIMSARGQLWEASTEEEHHDHLICTKCGMTIEFSDDLLSGFGERVAERKGYRYQESRFDIFGFCKDCKGSLDSATVSGVASLLDEAIEDIEDGRQLLENGAESVTQDKDRNVAETIEKARRTLRDALDRCDQALRLLETDLY